jgi:hypothetical protein
MSDVSTQRRVEAQVAFEEKQEALGGLLLKLRAVEQRAAKLSRTIRAIEFDPTEPHKSEAALLMLCPADYEGMEYATVRELGNEIVAARRDVTEAKALARAVGCRV